MPCSIHVLVRQKRLSDPYIQDPHATPFLLLFKSQAPKNVIATTQPVPHKCLCISQTSYGSRSHPPPNSPRKLGLLIQDKAAILYSERTGSSKFVEPIIGFEWEGSWVLSYAWRKGEKGEISPIPLPQKTKLPIPHHLPKFPIRNPNPNPTSSPSTQSHTRTTKKTA